MSQERWDVTLQALGGPMASLGEQVFHGPIVRIGANPGPGGFRLTGYRGMDARQCVITAYSGGEVTVAPVGTNQVRLAPHPHVNWKDIDPLTGPEYLSKGCAMHLGPVGRGCSIQFMECRRLGMWTQGKLASEAQQVEAIEVSQPVASQATRADAVDARRVRAISASTTPLWFIGCAGVISMSATAMIATLVLVGRVEVKPLGPFEEGEEYYESVDIDDIDMPEEVLEGLKEPYRRFIGRENAIAANAAGSVYAELPQDPEVWDEPFFKYVQASMQYHLRSRAFFRRLESVKEDYHFVVKRLREEKMPEVFAGIPYQESRYQPQAQSFVCAKGYWQFMPEVAYRMEVNHGLDFKVRGCKITKSDGSVLSWSPSQLAPPPGVARGKVPYVAMVEGKPTCVIKKDHGCATDDRADLVKSTEAGIVALREAWVDREIAASGAAVQITILSHNAGYDDGRFGKQFAKNGNLLIAFRKWSKKQDPSKHHLFYGMNIRSTTHDDKAWNGSAIPSETQHYAYNIAAQHFLAVCYYGKNYPDMPAFSPWRKLALEENTYCAAFNIPSKEEVEKF